MHAELTLNTKRGLKTIWYDGVIRVRWSYNEPYTIRLDLEECYTTNGRELLIENNLSCKPYKHEFTNVQTFNVSEK